jgi:hypothetical protein
MSEMQSEIQEMLAAFGFIIVSTNRPADIGEELHFITDHSRGEKVARSFRVIGLATPEEISEVGRKLGFEFTGDLKGAYKAVPSMPQSANAEEPGTLKTDEGSAK